METIQAVSFTGHRPQGLQMLSMQARRQLRPLLRRELLDAVQKGCKTCYSGMAMGIDLIAAEEVLRLREQGIRLRLIAVLPFGTQAASYPPDWRERYRVALEQADEVVTLSTHYYHGCYKVRNQFLVEHCDRLIAVHNGNTKSGTAQTMRMAQEALKELHVYYPDENGNWKSRFEQIGF